LLPRGEATSGHEGGCSAAETALGPRGALAGGTVRPAALTTLASCSPAGMEEESGTTGGRHHPPKEMVI